jgi:hypothetical protein
MSAAADRRASAPRPWTHYVNDHFFDRLDLEPNLERLAFRFERLAREKPWCITSNDELSAQLGCSRNTLAAILIRGESRGWFRRVLVPGRHGHATGRLGIVLFVRPTDRPVATPETFDQVVEQIRAEIRRGSARSRPPRTLPFTDPIRRESAATGPQDLGTAVPKNWAPSVPKKWAPPSCSKEEIIEKETGTTTTATDGVQSPPDIHALPESSSSVPIPDPEPEKTGHPGIKALGDDAAVQDPAAEASTHLTVLPPAPIETALAPAIPPVAADLPAELVAAAAEAIPSASREWLSSLLRDCGGYSLDLALLVVAWTKVRRAEKPTRYARVALSGWLNKLRSGVLTLEDVRAEVQGRAGTRGSPRPFDPAVCLARLASHGWALVPHGPDQVAPTEIPGRSAPLWRTLPSDLRQEVAAYKAELKAYVLKRAAERRKAVGRGA